MLRWIVGLLLGLLLAVAAAFWLADTSAGHRFIADRIAALKPANGLRIKVGRIDGSIYGTTRIDDLRLYDTRGLFFEADSVALDWHPFRYLSNTLDIDRLAVPTATLLRSPALTPSKTKQPILPGFDIRVGQFAVQRLTLARGVTKPARTALIAGRADVRSGRALIDLQARTTAGDRLVIKLDSEPDRDRFDLSGAVDAPGDGVIASLTGFARPLAARVEGDGKWSDWRGRLIARTPTVEVADLALTARSGRYDVRGVIRPAAIVAGSTVARLTGPAMQVVGNARLDDQRLDTHLGLASPALRLSANGVADLSTSSFDGMSIDARLLDPHAALANLSGRDIMASVRLDGPFARSRFDYLVSAPRIAFDATGFENLRIAGRGTLGPQPVVVPIALGASRVTGVGDVAGGILRNLRVDGLLRVSSKLIVGDGLKLRSDKLTSTISILYDFTTGLYQVGASGALGRYLIPGLGIVDVKSTLRVVPGPNGQGIRVIGRGEVWVRRLDNAFIASLTGGLPRITTDLERGADGLIYFRNLQLYSPALRLTGSGYRRLDNSFVFAGTGQQARYGALRVSIDGPITRPRVDLLLANPLPSAKLSNVRVQLDPTREGFTWRAAGQSLLGSFSGNGAIVLPPGGTTVIRIANLQASGIRASGDLRIVPGGFAGQLAILGGGLNGSVALSPVGGVQRVEAHLNARDVKIVGPPLVVVQRGRVDLVALLDPRGTSIEATVATQGFRYADVALGRLAGTARLRGGVGEVRATFAGSRGRSFDMQTVVQVAPNRYVVSVQGTLDRRPITLAAPAVVLREGNGWRLQPVRVAFAGGLATVGGRYGSDATDFDATIERMPLTVLDIARPGLGLGGSASGRVTFRQPARGGAPTGSAMLRVRNLTRAGLVLVSKPVDAGVNAVLSGNGLALRAIAASGGATIGQAQARIAPLAGGEALTTRLMNAPLFAQLRYVGPADTLWRLTGVESFDLSGPLGVAADVGGTLARPTISGSLRTDALRLESPLSGTVLTNLKAVGRFDRSRLVVDSFTGTAGRGTVSGRAAFDLASANGFGIDVAVDARQATLIARDDFGATVTGPLRIVSSGGRGRISGNVTLDRSSFQLGRATAAMQVPRLKVREINRPIGSPRIDAAPMVWELAIKARAPDRVAVTGLGLDSEWRADLDLGGSLDAPRILGSAEIVRGAYEFAGKRFDIQRGVIRFQGSVPPDPIVDIVANANVQAINATITVTGTATRPEITFASVPALPQDELLSRLLFGTSITNLSAAEAFQLGAAVASLRGGGGGLDPINAVRRAIGLDRLRIVAADPATGAKTAVAAGKYLTRRTYVEVVSDGQGYSATRIEFAITRWLSLLSTISTAGRQGASVRVSKDY